MLTHNEIPVEGVALSPPLIQQRVANEMSPPPAAAFLAPQFDNIPKELKKHRRWVPWRAEGGTGMKPIKVPYDPTLPNSRAKSNDPQTWGTYEQALAAYLEGDYTGVGCMLNGDGVVGIDLDHCVVDGKPSSAAMSLMHDLGVKYIELSPSGAGIRGLQKSRV
jgi:primase-polymerase (primpol)-like protein